MIKNVYYSALNLQLFLPFLMKLEFIDRFSENITISNSTKISQLAAILFHADRRMNIHEGAFSRFS